MLKVKIGKIGEEDHKGREGRRITMIKKKMRGEEDDENEEREKGGGR